MKIKLFLSLSFVLIFSLISFSQSVKINPKKIKYHRKLPQGPEFRRNFTVTYPIIKSRLNTKVKRNLLSLINYNLVFDNQLNEAFEGSLWLSSLNYKIIFNKNNILDILLIMEGVGAYPWTDEEEVVIDLRKGDRLKASDIFLSHSIKKLLLKVIRKFDAEIKRSLNSKNGGDEQAFKDAKFTLKNLDDFSISDKGLTFIYDYNFSFAILALEPEGRFFFSWNELAPFIKRDGLLAQFIH